MTNEKVFYEKVSEIINTDINGKKVIIDFPNDGIAFSDIERFAHNFAIRIIKRFQYSIEVNYRKNAKGEYCFFVINK